MRIDLSKLTKPLYGENLLEDVSYFKSFTNEKENSISLNGDFKFIYTNNLNIKDEYLNEDFNIDSLNTIPVPSHIELNGYSIPTYSNIQYPWDNDKKITYDELPNENPCGIYFKDMTIQKEDKDYILQFHGFESALYLYINGNYVGYSTQNYTISSFNISSYLKNGKNRITIIVFKYSFASFLSDQDMWRMSGIHRDINLLILPKKHILDIDNKSILDPNLKDGILSLSFKTINCTDENTIKLVLSFEHNIIYENEVNLKDNTLNIEHVLYDVKKWSDEESNIYILDIFLKEKEIEIENTYIKIGFRRLDVKDGIVLLNGKRLIIYGVDKHEFNPTTGRVMPLSILKSDLLFLKQNNINAIRLSHYPNRVELYDYCDDLGIIVMDETAIETHGTWYNHHKDKDCEEKSLPGNNIKYKEITLKRGSAMLERDKNHPCVLFYSLGNESFASKNLEALYNYFKTKDTTRLVHYEGCFWNQKYNHISDMTSYMYPKFEFVEKKLKKQPKRPFILCEYSHSMGNSTGNLDEYVALTKYNNFMLGFIWDFVDQGIYKEGKYYYGGDFLDLPNDDNFCADGILTSDRKSNGKVKVVSYNYSKVKAVLNKDKITIINNRNFIDTRDLLFVYSLLENDKEVINQSFSLIVNPNSRLEIDTPKFEYKNKNYVQRLYIYSKKDNIYNKCLLYITNNSLFKDMKYNVYTFKHEKGKALKVYNNVQHVVIHNEDLTVSFYTPQTGKTFLESVKYKGTFYIQGKIAPTIFRPNSDNDMTIEYYLSNGYMSASKYVVALPLLKTFKILEQNDDKVKIQLIHTFLIGNKISNFKEIYTIYSDNTLQVDFFYKKRWFLPSPSIIGIRIPIVKKYNLFSYNGLGKEDSYPDRYLGLEYQTHNSDVKNEFIHYSMPQECGNHMFTNKVSINIEDKKLSFYALNETFSFKYLPYDEFKIEMAKREEELVEDNFNYLTINAFTKGVGGDDSWGSRVHKQYRGKYKKYTASFLIKIED